AEVSIGELFTAGIGPGLFIGIVLMVFAVLYARRMGFGEFDRDGQLPVLEASRRAFWALFMPFIILGGIYGGIFTPTEASAVAVLYALIVGVFIYREIRPSDLIVVLKKSVRAS